MALWSYALASVATLKSYIPVTGSGADARLELAINEASQWLENAANNHFITRGARTEYHTVRPYQHSIRLAYRPVISVTSVHETLTSPRTYDADALLTADTDYQLVAEQGLIRRLSSSEPKSWLQGYRAIKVIYSYGYADIASIPHDLQLLALYVATVIYKEADDGRWGKSSVTDGQGSVTRFMGYLPPSMQAKLDYYSTGTEFERTWEAA